MSARSRRPSRVGMTLIEIMIVIAVMAMLASGVIFGASAMPRARLRGSALRLASTFRFAYVHALTTGKTTRVSFTLGGGTLTVEDSDDRLQLDPKDPLRAGGSADVEAAATREAAAITQLRPRAPRAEFTALPGAQFRARPLEEGISIVRLYSQHDEEPREEGNGRVYFFSGGQAERVVVHLRNSKGDTFSVTLDPLTGRSEVFDRPVEPPPVEEREDVETDTREQRPRTAE